MAPSLRAVGVAKRFAGVQALDGVSLALARSDILGLIGPNGSGKSTLVNVLAGFLRPDAGSVLLGDTELVGATAQRVSRLGVARTFQTVRLFATMTVAENVRLGVLGGRHAAVDDEVDGLLDRFGLTGFAAQPATQLPYGLQRRVEVARALATRPSFLLLDEPAAGLNEAESEELLVLIRGLREDCGILVIDHDLRLIMRLCDRIHVLNEGRTVTEGLPADVKRHPDVIEAYLGSRQTGVE